VNTNKKLSGEGLGI